jgi:hypothetical protein
MTTMATLLICSPAVLEVIACACGGAVLRALAA